MFTRDGGRRWLPVPNASQPRLLIPSGPGAASATVIDSFMRPTGAGRKIAARALGIAARLNVLALLPTTVGGHAGIETRLMAELARHFGPDFVVGVYLGPPRANRKPVLALVRKDGRLEAFVKLAVSDLTSARLAHESRALMTLTGVAVPGLVTPRVLAEGEWAPGQRFLAITPVSPTSGMATEKQSNETLAGLTAAFPTRDVALASSRWWCGITDRLDDSALGRERDVEAMRAAVHRFASVAGSMVVRFGAAHGDWSPWNIARHGQGVAAWDWERFSTEVPIGCDALHFRLQSTARDGAREAVQSLLPLARVSSQINRGDPRAGYVILGAYLCWLGERYLTDGQVSAGAAKGRLTQWLLPCLTELTEELEGRV